MSRVIEGAAYQDAGDAVYASYRYESHANYAVSVTQVTTPPIDSVLVLICCSSFYRFDVNKPATATSPMHPPGFQPLIIDRGDTLSFIAFDADCECSVIIPGGVARR